MQGPTYALCYTTIVAYASAVSPPGTSATVQGIVAGMDDGLGKFLFLSIKNFITKKVCTDNINVFFSRSIKIHFRWNIAISSGFAFGSLIGGILYKNVGGATTLQIFSALAAFSAFMYLILHILYLKHKTPGKGSSNFNLWNMARTFRTLWRKKTSFFIIDTRNNVEWREPDDARKDCVVAEWYPFYIVNDNKN